MEGAHGKLEGLSNPRDEGVLMQIRMYDRAAYLHSFEKSVKSAGDGNDAQREEEDMQN